MDNAILNSEIIATKQGILPSITMMVKLENIFPLQMNILLLASVSLHIPV